MPPVPPRRRSTIIKEFAINIPPRVKDIDDHVKLEIVSKTGTVTTVTLSSDEIIHTDPDISTGQREQIVVILQHLNREYLNSDGSFKWTGGETVKIYQDYETSSLTDSHLWFKGKIHHPTTSSNGGAHEMNIVGIKLPEIHDRRQSRSFAANTKYYDAAKTILNEYSDLIDTTDFDSELSGDDGVFQENFDDYDFNILATIFRKAGWSGYFDNDPTDSGKFKIIGKVDNSNNKNEDVAGTYNQTLIDVFDFGVNTEDVYTRIDVTGAQRGGSSILWRSIDAAEEANLWRRDLPVQDNNLLVLAEAIERGSFELAEATSKPWEGTIIMIGDRRLRPGQYFRVSSQNDGVNGWFKAAAIEKSLTNNFIMVVEISRQNFNTPIGRLVELQEKFNDILEYDNPNGMLWTPFNFTFDDNGEMSVDTGLTFEDGKIKTAGEGSFTSVVVTLPQNASMVDMILEDPDNISDSKLFVSGTGDENDEVEINISDENIVYSLPTAGNEIQVRFILVGSAASIGGLTVRAK